jgi:hypothetical protein
MLPAAWGRGKGADDVLLFLERRQYLRAYLEAVQDA